MSLVDEDRILEDILTGYLTPAHMALKTDPSWVLHPHLMMLNERITEAFSTPDTFLVIELPVRHGKSELTTVNGSAWAIATWPDEPFMLATHTDALTRRFGRQIRGRIRQVGPALGLVLSRESNSNSEFQFMGKLKPSFIGISVGGTPTGSGGQRILVDDPIRDYRAVSTLEGRDQMWDWFRETLRSRLGPGGSMVIVMSRWHKDDIIGRIFDPAYGTGDPWQRLHLPAIAQENDPLGRAPGEPLAPGMGWTREALERIKRSVSTRIWSANYQCDPQVSEGQMFRRDKWGYTPAVPAGSRMVRWWDQAATSKEDGGIARTAGVLLAMTPNDDMIVVDVVTGLWNSAERREMQRATAIRDRQQWSTVAAAGVTQGAEQEPGSGGKDQAQLFKTVVMAGIPAVTETTGGVSKEIRAETWSAQQLGDRVSILAPDGIAPRWASDFIDEHAEFPAGTLKDQVDAASHGYNWLALKATVASSSIKRGASRRDLRRR